jgi:hypothetical protein
MHGVTLLVGIGGVEALEDLVRFRLPVVVLIRFPEVVAQLADRVLNGLGGVLIRTLDVAERDHLLHRFMRRNRIELCVRRMAPVAAPFIGGYVFPARNRTHRRDFLEGVREHLAVHVFAHRQPEQRQNGRRDVQYGRAVQQFVFADAGPADGEDAESRCSIAGPAGISGIAFGRR